MARTYWVTVKVFESIRVGISRFRFVKFGAMFRDDQDVCWNLFGFVVQRKLEAVRQKGLDHALILQVAPIGAKLAQLIH